MKQEAVIIVAGGAGERTQKNTPKQFVEINNKAIIIYSVEKFIQYNEEMIVVIVCHEKYIKHCHKLIEKYFKGNINIINGGETRFHSVKNGLEYLNKINFSGIVGIHDAARPCLSVQLIKRCFEDAQQYKNAIPAIPLYESVREIKNNSNTTINRNRFVIVQTPQCAIFSIIYKAFQKEYQEIFTDEANVLESYGEQMYLCEGERENIKVTYPIDFKIAETILQNKKNE